MCQLLKAGPRFDRPYQKRININVPALTKISMDIKLHAGHSCYFWQTMEIFADPIV